jgi:hypothetical protein
MLLVRRSIAAFRWSRTELEVGSSTICSMMLYQSNCKTSGQTVPAPVGTYSDVCSIIFQPISAKRDKKLLIILKRLMVAQLSARVHRLQQYGELSGQIQTPSLSYSKCSSIVLPPGPAAQVDGIQASRIPEVTVFTLNAQIFQGRQDLTHFRSCWFGSI